MLSLHPELLRRYRDLARLLVRHGGKQLLSPSGVNELGQLEADLEGPQAQPEELARDLEQLGRT